MALDPEQITAKNFKEFYNRILPYLNGAGGNDYSTDEKVVGSWIDGKPLYQKTVDCGMGPNATQKLVPHGISDIKLVVDIRGTDQWTGTPVEANSLPMSHPTLSANVELCVRDGNIRVTAGTDISNMQIYATIQYTKTTD